ncbi:hypothetical protein [Aestuariibius sp. HNIBRBA575]|uniref:hypothetical protein n=1 Tax=Aestuariibius sp. HNIBRBA575 TaxID=3233343 RepID=UPI0034A16DE0
MYITQTHGAAAHPLMRAHPARDIPPAPTFQTDQTAVPPEPDPTGPAAVALIKSEYDMTNISPREVDEMVDRMIKAGDDMNGDLLMLLTHGEGFRQHLANTFGGTFDPNEKQDLVAQSKVQLQLAKQFGDPTEYLTRFIAFLDTFGGQSGEAAQISETSTVAAIVRANAST